MCVNMHATIVMCDEHTENGTENEYEFSLLHLSLPQ